MSKNQSVPHRHTRRSFLKLGAAAASIGVTSVLRPTRSAAPAQPPAAVPKRGGTLTVAHTDSFVTFNPYERRWYRIRRTMYNSLGHYDRHMNLQPELAERWDLSADGKDISFKLREGVKFHSGREMTSEDVKFSI